MESGRVLLYLKHEFLSNRSKETLFPLLSCLRDSNVIVPVNITTSDFDKEQFLNWIDNIDTLSKITSARGKSMSRFAKENVRKMDVKILFLQLLVKITGISQGFMFLMNFINLV